MIHQVLALVPAQAALFEDKSLVLLLRLSPMMPDSVMNYALAVSCSSCGRASVLGFISVSVSVLNTGSLYSRSVVKGVTTCNELHACSLIRSVTYVCLCLCF